MIQSGLMRRVLEEYARVLPQDRIDSQWYMSDDTFERLQRELPVLKPSGAEWLASYPATILGIRIEIDENMPPGVIQLRTENDVDRAIRRANAAGLRFNVMKLETPSVADFPAPPPQPTLRALLRSYWNTIRGFGRKR